MRTKRDRIFLRFLAGKFETFKPAEVDYQTEK